MQYYIVILIRTRSVVTALENEEGDCVGSLASRRGAFGMNLAWSQ